MGLFDDKKECEEVLVVTYATTASAFAFKTCALQYQLEGRLIPVPRLLSAGCGMAWSEPARNAARLEDMLAHEGLDYERVVPMRL